MGGGGLQVGVEGRRILVPPGGHADIGRSAVCAIQVSDRRASPVHAVVWSTPEGWCFTDRDSSYGSWLDGERVVEQLITGPTVLSLADPLDGTPISLEPRPPAAAGPGPSGPSPSVAATVQTARPASRPTGAFQASHAATNLVRIGRAEDNDVVLDDLLVSRHHAELHARADGTTEIVDLGSLNGTYLNGGLTQRAVVDEFDLIGVGHSEFRLVDGRLEEYVDVGEVTFEARGLAVEGRDGRTLVDDVSFALAERSLLAVIGPSGAGKSTLLTALSGLRPAPVGRVLYGGRDLYADYAELRHRIGLVPQEDVVHRELTLRRALDYSGRLRFPPDVTDARRGARVDEVLAELGISHRALSPIHELSGGERKRVNVALELLTKPSLLLLDEPVAGLDPGLARVLMRLLRDLADGGRTVVVVTHEISSLSVCDQVLVLAPGGVPAYVGPPDGAAAHFGETDIADVFTDLVTREPTSWHIGRARNDRAPLAPPRSPTPPPPPGAPEPARAKVRAARQGWWSQLRTLSARYVEVLASDRRNAALLLLQAPILGVLILAALPAGELGPPQATEVRLVSAAGIVLFVLLVGATWLGANNAIREIARELPMFRRERAAGLSLSAYVVSKALVLGALTTAQAVVLVALATARQDGPADAVLLGWAPGELMAVVALAGVASMALALFISALAGTPERATSVLPVVLILQLVLAAGVVLPEIVDKPVLNQMSLLSSAQWGIAGAASTVDLNELQVFDERLRDLRTVDAADPAPAVEALAADPSPRGRWAHEASAWLTALLVLTALTVVPLVGTGLALRRHDPGRT
jgi:ABC-type multidrug transport system ATPase subunit/pSer/pThr/pTyr-binding forkhead associated (FHA) protein